MSKPIARVGDAVFNTADAHNIGPMVLIVPVVGVIMTGSDDTFTNDRANAITDPDKKSPHILCPGANQFHCATGSEVIFTNDFHQTRSSDRTEHCGSSTPGGTRGFVLPVCSLDAYA